MADAPERMTLQPCPTYGWDHPDRVKHAVGHTVEYVRADLTPPAAVIEAMERALREISDLTKLSAGDFADKHPVLDAKLDAETMEHWHAVLSSRAAEALTDLQAWRDAQ